MAQGDRFVPLDYQAVKSLLETEMGFTQRQPERTRELCWERRVVTNGEPTPYAIRVYSTLEPTGECREIGSDAIRVCLVDQEDPSRERILEVEKKVLRTKSAMINLRARARELYGYVNTSAHRCPVCGRLMVVRTTKRTVAKPEVRSFFGCMGFSHEACKHTSNVIPETARL
jgi:hypothetical protein